MLRDPLFPGRRNLPVAMPIQPVRASECNGGWRSYPPICLVQTRNTGYLCVSILIVIGFPGSTDLILIIRCELLAHTVAPLEPSPKIVLIFLRIFPREPPIVLPLFCIVAVDQFVIKTHNLRLNRVFGEKPCNSSPRLGTPHPVNSRPDDPLDYPRGSGTGVRCKVAVDVSLLFFIRASSFQRCVRCVCTVVRGVRRLGPSGALCVRVSGRCRYRSPRCFSGACAVCRLAGGFACHRFD